MKKGFILLSFSVIWLGFGSINQSLAQSDSTSSKNSFSLMSINSSYQDNLSLRINGGGKGLRFVKIFDIIGKEVTTIDVSGQSYPVNFEVNLSDYKQNIFIFNLYSDKGLVESKKFFRQRVY